MCSSLLLLTISSKFFSIFPGLNQANVLLCLSSSLLSYGCSLIEARPRKCQGFGKCRFSVCEKDRYFFNNAAKNVYTGLTFQRI